MAQIVHDLAPGANIAFASAYGGETRFANNIAALVSAGAGVVVDDVVYANEPIYQDGPIAVAMSNARAAGTAVFSAAGNSTITLGGRNVSSYEALSYRGGTCPTLPFSYLDCHSFNPSSTDVTYGMTVPNGRTVELAVQWAQPRGGVTTDMDVYVLNAATGAVLDKSDATNNGAGGTQQPYEFVSWINSTGATVNVNVVVGRYAGPAVRFKWLQWADSPSAVEYSTTTATDVFGPAIWGHDGAASTFSVAAVRYSSPSAVEPYTSNGPVTVLFNPVPSTAALASPQVLNKPDFAATDCGQNSFFGSGSPRRFCGTSAAAPHAAAVAALLRQLRPTLGPAQLGTALASTARPVGSAPATVVGAGLIDANAAVQQLRSTPSITTTASPAVTLGGAVRDTATLSSGTNPTGSITFTLYGPNDASCTGTAVFTSTVPVNGNGTYTSTDFVPAAAGTYRWTASYSGDGGNNAVSIACNAPNESVTVSAPSSSDFTPLPPSRILDTRVGIGGLSGPIGTSPVDVRVTGVGGVPSTGVAAVVMNVTVTQGTASSNLVVYPTGQPRPSSSNLNFSPNEDVANLVVAKVGTNGMVTIANYGGTVHVIFDVAGWYAPSPACFVPLAPARILDTRTGTGGISSPVGPGQTVNVAVVGVGGVPTTGVGAVVMNVTVTQGTASSNLVVYPKGQPQPSSSNLNFVAGQDVPNLVMAKVGANGSVSVTNYGGTVHVIFDVAGWYPDTAACFTPLAPARILDSRDGTGGYTGPVGPGQVIAVTVLGRGGVPSTGVSAVALNLTATEGTASTFLTVYPCGQPRPDSSNLNVTAGQDRPNLVVVKVGTAGQVCVYNNAGTVHFILDVAGAFRT